MSKLKTFRIVSSSCRMVRHDYLIKGKDRIDALNKDKAKRAKKGIYRYEVFEVKKK